MEVALRKRQRAVLSAELVARAVDWAEDRRDEAVLCRVEAVLRLDVGIGAVANGVGSARRRRWKWEPMACCDWCD